MTCLKCGACCRSVGVWAGAMSPEVYDYLRWSELHGATILYAPKAEVYGVEYPIPCSLLTPDGLCADFGHRPEICRTNVPELSGCVQTPIVRMTLADIGRLE